MPNSTSIAHKSVDLSSLSPLETATAAISKKNRSIWGHHVITQCTDGLVDAPAGVTPGC